VDGVEQTFRFLGNGRVAIVDGNMYNRSDIIEKKDDKRQWKIDMNLKTIENKINDRTAAEIEDKLKDSALTPEELT